MRSSLADVIVAQHRRILELVDEVASARTRVRQRRGAAALAAAYAAHAGAEEELVYGAVPDAPMAGAEALEEHAMIAFAISRVAASRGALEHDARVRLLRELFVRHQDVEERVRVPAVVRTLSADRAARIARRLELRFERALESSDGARAE